MGIGWMVEKERVGGEEEDGWKMEGMGSVAIFSSDGL